MCRLGDAGTFRADRSLQGHPMRSSACCSVIPLISVASIPTWSAGVCGDPHGCKDIAAEDVAAADDDADLYSVG